MRNYDFSPLYRSAIGFDRMVDLINSVSRSESAQPNYPPYNIESFGDDEYRITLAVAGFSQKEISIEVEQNSLVIKGSKDDGSVGGTYLHRGIAARNFERKFQLDDHVKVTKASSENGLLYIDLVREVPEAMKPRSIAIENVSDAKTIDNQGGSDKAAA